MCRKGGMEGWRERNIEVMRERGKHKGYTVHVRQKNATNMPQRHLKTWRHVRRVLPPCAPHFDGCVPQCAVL